MKWMNKITDKDRRKLLRMRLKTLKYPATITRIKLQSIYIDRFSAVIYSKEYAPECQHMVFEKFYLNEIGYLLKRNILTAKLIKAL